MTQTLESIRAEHAAKLAKAEREFLTLERVKALMPEWQIKPGSIHSTYAAAFVELDAESFADALLIMERASPLNLFHVKDSCTSFRPEAAIKPEWFDKADAGEMRIDSCGPAVYRLEYWKHTGATERTLIFYVQREELRIECRVNVARDPEAYFTETPCRWNRQGEPVEWRKRATDKANRFLNVANFATGGADHDSAVLWGM